MAPEFVFGDGARGLTAHYVKNLEIHRPLLITDEGVLASGWPQQVIEGMEGEDIGSVVFSNVTANPKDTEVMCGAAFFAQAECDAIVAIGGGSVIDCAKGIGIVISNGGHIRDYEGIDQVPAPCPPLICVPTTAGSAADVSQFAIITDSERLNKMAMVSKVLVPDVSLVDVDSTPGEGTRFHLYFPAADQPSESETTQETAADPPGGRETILLAEDDQLVRELTHLILEKAGYRVVAVRDGQEAVDRLRADPKGFDLALLDLVMPKKSGRAVYRVIQAEKWKVPVLFCTGYSFDALGSDRITEDPVRVIRKPFTPNELRRTVREILTQETSPHSD